MTQVLSRRTFLKYLSGCVATAALQRALRPAFVLAQAAPSAIKNVVEVFCYGGYDARHLFPYYDGPVRKALVDADLRSALTIDPTTILGGDILNQGDRQNLVGLHSGFSELLDVVKRVEAGITLIDQFGITRNSSNSHDVAQKQFRNGLSKSNANVQQGYMGRLLDATKLPGLAVWSFGLNEPTYMSTLGANRPMMVSSTSSISFVDRNFGSFNCANIQGAACSGSGDWTTSGSDDSAFARSVIRELNNTTTEEIPLSSALQGALNGAFQLVPVVQKFDPRDAAFDASFRPANYTYLPGFCSTMGDIARAIKFLNSSAADPAVQASTKIMSVGLSGWDTHSSQTSTLASSMAILGAGLKGLLSYLSNLNLLNDTIVLVYSEFGRTTKQNGSSGTDHGLAGTAMVLGGKNLVKRAVVGPDPSLSELSKNMFTPQVAVTGLLRQVYGHAGLTNDQLDQVFPERLPGETPLPFLI